MYEQHLKQVHLSRLSPVMWAWKDGYPRKELGVGIRPAYNGMGSYATQAPYEQVTGINPAGDPVWNNLYRIGVAGKLSRTTPFGPDAFSGCGCRGVGTEIENGSGNAMLSLWPLLLAFGAFGLITYLGTGRNYK